MHNNSVRWKLERVKEEHQQFLISLWCHESTHTCKYGTVKQCDKPTKKKIISYWHPVTRGYYHTAILFSPAYPVYSACIRHCPFHYYIFNNIKDHGTSSRNRNRGNRGNIKSRQRGPSRLRLCFLHPDLNLTEWLTLPMGVNAHDPQLLLSPTRFAFFWLTNLFVVTLYDEIPETVS